MEKLKKNVFYITTTLPYINAQPHIGFAKEIIQADVWSRFWRDRGKKVFFNTGTDEHGQKIFQKAQSLKKEPQEYCDAMSEEFSRLRQVLNLRPDNFIRTTDKKHLLAVQAFWRICQDRGDIYKKNYKAKYCVGCELEKTESELINGRCPEHPNQELQIIEEENYFFRFSKYQKPLLEFFRKNPSFVYPAKRMKEVFNFVEKGLEDFSISRLKSKLAWGVPVPGDDQQVIYVWFDALINYISTLGWPEDKKKFSHFWPGIQICGKDNLRQQAAMWQAMLMSAGLSNSLRIFVNGFLTVDGQKMSKSLGNVISPYEMVEKFGVDATRYLLLSGASFGEDFDISWKKLTEKYNADLANGLGNLVSRVIRLYEKSTLSEKDFKEGNQNLAWERVEEFFVNFQLEQVLSYVMKIVQKDNQYIDENKPWELIKKDLAGFKKVMKKLLKDLNFIADLAQPFLPDTAEKIKKALREKKTEILFIRKQG